MYGVSSLLQDGGSSSLNNGPKTNEDLNSTPAGGRNCNPRTHSPMVSNLTAQIEEEDQELNSFFDPKEMLMSKYPEVMKEENKIILTPRKTEAIDFGST